MLAIILSLVVGFCAAAWVHHISWQANARSNILGRGYATWNLVIITFIGAAALTYGVIAL